MRLVIFGLPNQVDDSDIQSMVEAIIDTLELPIHVTVLDQKDLLDITIEKEGSHVSRIKDSKFIEAIKAVIDACNCAGEDITEPEVRSEFYKLVLSGTIERPILETIAFGPKSRREILFLTKNKLNAFVDYAKVALNMIV